MQSKVADQFSELAPKADFSQLRYAQVWEDADVLREGLALRPGDHCLSIASAGDNALALLLDDPERVVAVDLNPAQLAALELRVAAFRRLEHGELLVFIGSREEACRGERESYFQRCRSALTAGAQRFWDSRSDWVANGIGAAGKFEHYFACFRRWILPLTHSQRQIQRLLHSGSRTERERFFNEVWNNVRWRLLFKAFFSRPTMGLLGRDPRFFDYVERPLTEHLRERVRHALVELNPAENPYLAWILTGRHGSALPVVLREENFLTIRDRLDRLEWYQGSLDEYLAHSIGRFHGANLSDIFEYLSPAASETILNRVVDSMHPGGRLFYWNMIVPRYRPASMAGRLRPHDDLAISLHAKDKAFFYSRIVIEEVTA